MAGGTAQTKTQRHVIIVGAGPAGLLAAIKLLMRNNSGKSVEYSVEVVEGSEDFGSLESAGVEKKRSWMIGLSTHGLTALKSVPGLYEDYVSKVGVQQNGACIYLGGSRIVAKDDNPNNFVVDRNYIVRAIARFLSDHFKGSGLLKMRYNTRVNFVDGEKRRVFVTDGDGNDHYLPYDLLLGCDGVRSAVRAALVAKHRDFECNVSDIFTEFKAVHVDIDQLEHKGIPIQTNMAHVFPGSPKNFNGIALAETGGKINVMFGYHKNHKEGGIAKEMLSDDPKVVAQFLRDNFKPFTLPYDDVAEQLVAQPWSTTGMVTCNYYHSLKLSLVIMGDAAHATSPAIGQGMNTALADAQAFDELLDSHGDDLARVLPAFSEERVKEGNALTAISLYAYSLSPAQQFRVMLFTAARMVLHSLLPSIVDVDPIVAIGKGQKLSAAYNTLTKIGRLPAVRAVCEDVRRRHFERVSGMVVDDPRRSTAFWFWSAAVATAVATAVAVSAHYAA